MRTFEEGDGEAWEAARAEVDAGSPALLLTDLYYLDHYGNSAHFPGHAVVLAGYDDEVAHLSDTGFEELQTTRLENLDRGPPQQPPRLPARRPHVHRLRGGRPRAGSATAIPAAIERAAKAMLEPELRRIRRPRRRPPPRRRGRLLARGRRGLAVVRPLRLPGDRAPRHRRRRLPPHVLALPRGGRAPEEAPLAAEAAARWTELATAFHAASENDSPDPTLWRAIDTAAHRVAEAEERLWTSLAR